MNALRLREEFPAVTVEEWERTIARDLKGADYEKRLVWRPMDGIAIRPYYTRQNVENLGSWVNTAPGQFPFARGDGRPWESVDALETGPVADVAADAWHNAGATAVEELAFSMAAGVELLENRLQDGIGIDDAAARMVFRYAVGSQFFIEIAKLRAARLLWAQIVTAFEGSASGAAYLHIHAVTATANKTAIDPHNNLLRASAEALAAVLGGCDWLTVLPMGVEPRMAHNIGLILREEAHLDRVSDAAGGSYYVESVTSLLGQKAWILFQQIEGAGGFAAYRDSGTLDDALARSRAAVDTAVRLRRRTAVGVNAYANSAEVIATEAEIESGWRVAEGFEQLRRRMARHKAKTGQAARVLLLEAGDGKMRKARSGFAAAFFACGGFETIVSSELAPSDLVVLCSSDAEYLDLAAKVCPLAQAPVLIAGNPVDRDALLTAGVSGFIHLGSDAVAALTDWQNRLGLGE